MRIIKSIPGQNIYFQESVSKKGNIAQGRERGIINIYDEIKYQPILGIGGAFTESSAYNYSLLTPAQKKDFMEKHFSRDKGIGYNFGRCHIGSCDFSLDIYSYVEQGDPDLSTFTLEPHSILTAIL